MYFLVIIGNYSKFGLEMNTAWLTGLFSSEECQLQESQSFDSFIHSYVCDA